MIESLQLGSLTLVGERRGPYIAVRSERDYADGATVCYLTATEWHSLLALADTKLAGEREVERLRAEISALREANRELAGIAKSWAQCGLEYTSSEPEARAHINRIAELQKAGTP